MIERELEVLNKFGLHARPAAQLVQVAKQFNSEIMIEKDGERVNAKSIMGVLMLACAKGQKIKLIAEGEDEENAITALTNLINDKFGVD
ncbi:MAG: HPr family phosphocarrier protein [bacterium]